MAKVIELSGDYVYCSGQENYLKPFLRSIVAGETHGVGDMPDCNLVIARQIKEGKLVHIKAVECRNNSCRINICAFNQ